MFLDFGYGVFWSLGFLKYSKILKKREGEEHHVGFEKWGFNVQPSHSFNNISMKLQLVHTCQACELTKWVKHLKFKKYNGQHLTFHTQIR